MRTLLDLVFQSEKKYSDDIFSSVNCIYSFVNPYGYSLMRKNKEIFGKLDGLFVDGILMCLLCRIVYGYCIHRRSFDNTTVAKDLFQFANKNKKKVYLLGAKKGIVEQSVLKYREAYPDINFIGFRNGYFCDEIEYKQTINAIISLSPDFVIVGLGVVKQEKFLIDLKDNGFCGIGFSCGGFIHQTINGINYFPDWINRFHLRAFYRLYKEKNTWNRLFNVIIKFPVLFIYDYLCLKRK